MIQHLIIALSFAAALFYLGRLIYKQFTAKTACATGCGKCSAIDFKKIEQKIKDKAPTV